VYKVAIITDSETATGFRLAGVEVKEAATSAEALELLRQYIAAGYGLVAVNEGLLQGTRAARARILRGRDLPVIVSLPAARVQQESAETYIQRLVKEHLGLVVKLAILRGDGRVRRSQ